MKQDIDCGLDRRQIACNIAAVTRSFIHEVLSVVTANEKQAMDLCIADQDLADA